nr:MAG TPA: hypothetical protein [Bacteriophage sp.]
MQCLNKWRLSSEKSWEPQKKRGYHRCASSNTSFKFSPFLFVL